MKKRIEWELNGKPVYLEAEISTSERISQPTIMDIKN